MVFYSLNDLYVSLLWRDFINICIFHTTDQSIFQPSISINSNYLTKISVHQATCTLYGHQIACITFNAVQPFQEISLLFFQEWHPAHLIFWVLQLHLDIAFDASSLLLGFVFIDLVNLQNYLIHHQFNSSHSKKMYIRLVLKRGVCEIKNKAVR